MPFAQGTAQYKWFVADVAAIDRVSTPWVIVSFHAPPYHSYYVHYKEMECFMSVYEPLFLQARVDFVINGHIHAYERTHPMFNYAKDQCGPVYITIGDGGNVEGPYRNYVDDIVPGSTPPTTYCAAAFTNSIAANPYFAPSPGYQTQVHPAGCAITSYQPPNGKAGGPGVIPNPVVDPSLNTYFCQSSQPVWSAYRDPSFGFAGLTFINDTAASFSWYRNIDQTPGATTLTAIDSTTFSKYTGLCTGNVPALTPVATTLFSPAPAVFSGMPFAATPTGTYVWGSNAANILNASANGQTNPVNGAFTPLANAATNKAWRAGDAFVAYPTGFSAGVQTGDPLPGQIMVWTRFQPSNDQSAKAAADPTNTAYMFNYLPAAGYIPVAVSWWVGPNSSAPLASGVYTTDGSRDWVVKIDVAYGAVAQQTVLSYGFSATDPATSAAYTATGTFRALASSNLSQLNYAVVSCSNWVRPPLPACMRALPLAASAAAACCYTHACPPPASASRCARRADSHSPAQTGLRPVQRLQHALAGGQPRLLLACWRLHLCVLRYAGGRTRCRHVVPLTRFVGARSQMSIRTCITRMRTSRSARS